MSFGVTLAAGRTRARIGAALLVSAALSLPALVFSQAKAPQKSPSPSAKSSSTSTAKKPSKRKRVRRARGQQAPSTERVKEIQQALAREGRYAGEPTGKWDAATIEAMKSFQAANGFPVTGKLDARSLQKLGLGSEVAGVAPPRSMAASSDAPATRPR